MKRDRRGVTRRQIAAAFLAAPAVAQTPPVSDLEAVRRQTQQTREQLRKFKVPQLLEPSFAFRP
jgi:hypothetical protein